MEKDCEVCESCDYPASDIQTYTVGKRTQESPYVVNAEARLCRVCACTHLSDGIRGYPIEPSHDYRVSVAWCFNALMDEIRSLRQEMATPRLPGLDSKQEA